MSINDGDLRRIDQLAEIINTMKSNVIPVRQLEQFAPLFTKPDPNNPVPEDEISRLSSDFKIMFDLYRSIDVIDESGNILFKIPQLFLPISDVKKEYGNLLAEFRNNGTSDIPKYASEATNCALVAILKSQDIGSTEQGYASFKDMIQVKSKEYQRDVAGFNAERAVVTSKRNEELPPSIGSDDGFSWE